MECDLNVTGLLVTAIDCAPEALAAVFSSHDHQVFPALLAMPGVVGARDYVAPAHLVALHRPPEQEAFGIKQSMVMSMVTLTGEITPRATKPVLAGLSPASQSALAYSEVFALRWAMAPPDRPLDQSAIAHLPHSGIQMSLGEVADPARRQDVQRWYREIHSPDVLAVPGSVAGFMLHSVEPGHEGRNLVMFFLDADPGEVAAEINQRIPRWHAQGRSPSPGRASRALFTGPIAAR